MSNPLLTLGAFSFEGLESPDRIILKSKQHIVVHHLGSGLLMADSLGEESKIASFRGTFSGLNATIRIRAIEYMRTQGLPVLLAWDSQTLLVLIQEFELTYLSSQWIPYRIVCLVVQSLASGETELDSILSSPATQANDLANLIVGTAVSPTPVQLTAFIQLATTNYDVAPSAAMISAQDLLGSIADNLATVSEASSNPTSVSGVVTGATVTWLADIVSNCGQCASLMLAQNRLLSVVVQAEVINQP